LLEKCFLCPEKSNHTETRARSLSAIINESWYSISLSRAAGGFPQS